MTVLALGFLTAPLWSRIPGDGFALFSNGDRSWLMLDTLPEALLATVAGAALCVATGRLPGPVESAAYFVVAEALANAAKHARAAEIAVRVSRHRDLLVVEVIDDGAGGADPAGGSGLRGLADRVAAVDGRLLVTSPPGGPTVVRAELPCGS